MVTPFKVQLKVLLSPIWHQEPPHVIVACSDKVFTEFLEQPKYFIFEFDSVSYYETLTIVFDNKTNQDTNISLGLDKAIFIKEIEFFGINDPRFVHAGIYYPKYPEPWASQQPSQPPETISPCQYLGFNGKWTLTFSIPVFTWIHKIQDLGWIYD